MNEGWTNSKLIDDIIIRCNKLTHVIAICSLVDLDELELETFHSLLHSIHLFQIFFYFFITYLDIRMDPPDIIKGIIYHKHPLDTMFIPRVLSHNYSKMSSEMKGSVSKDDIKGLR